MENDKSAFSPITLMLFGVIGVFVWTLVYRVAVPPETRASEYLADFFMVPPEQIKTICDEGKPTMCTARHKGKEGELMLRVQCGILQCTMK